MKLRKYVLLLLFLVQSFVFAQILPFDINPKFGVNYSHLSQADNNRSEGAYSLGLDLRFGNKIMLIPGIYYNNISANLQYNQNSVFLEYDNSISTLRFQTLVGFPILSNTLLKVRVVAGPSLEFPTASKNIDLNNVNELFSFFTFGAGLDFGFLSFDIHYLYGLSNVYNHKGDNKIAINTKNRIVNITCGFVF